MLTSAKTQKLLNGIKEYRKQFFSRDIQELDESGTRIMVNHILTDLLGYKSLEEIKTEYMIKGTYADYVVQIEGDRHFLVEVKALSLALSNKHLRQAIEYAANEGVEWVVLTNGRILQLYKVIFAQPIDSKMVFEINLSTPETVKGCLECLQFLHRDSVVKKGLNQLWNDFMATEKTTIASILLSKPGITFLRRQIRSKFKSKFDEKVVAEAARRMISEPVNLEEVKVLRTPAAKGKKKVKVDIKSSEIINPSVTMSTNN
ncbi:MAG TPA: type I restriction enzyme HsdR N-terminal domain-containing protein [Chryseosolibacter sp.]